MLVVFPIDLSLKSEPNLTFMRRKSAYEETFKQGNNAISYWSVTPFFDGKAKRITLSTPKTYVATIESVYKSSSTSLPVVEYCYPFGDSGMIISKQIDTEFAPALISPRLNRTSAFVFRARPIDES